MNIDFTPQMTISWPPALILFTPKLSSGEFVFQTPTKPAEIKIDFPLKELSLAVVRRGLKLVDSKVNARIIPIADAGNMPGIDIEETIAKYYSLVKYLAAKLAMKLPPHISMDDLISTGIIGLIDAHNKFNSSKGVKFKTYAEFRIRGAMLDELRSLDWVPRSIRRKMADIKKAYDALTAELNRPPTDEEVANQMNISLDQFYKLSGNTTAAMINDCDTVQTEDGDPISTRTEKINILPLDEIAKKELKPFIEGMINQLPRKEQIVLSLYYKEELTMNEIGRITGYTESRISQLHTKAIAHLKNLISGQLKDYLYLQ